MYWSDALFLSFKVLMLDLNQEIVSYFKKLDYKNQYFAT